MGASLTMIDRHYGHLTSDGVGRARRLLNVYSSAQKRPWTLVDARWTSQQPELITGDNQKPKSPSKRANPQSPLTDSNR
jgi:hypothetical protein